ncbi:TPA: ribosome recycling factor [Candidatus Campbellbacteria bacterium]|nr:MAG: Frr, ribosome recycling factor [Candidatus Campbellbacteria bacterium GW2011_OD1_34_28]KKP74607.1 MAG: Ribosome-recycling factor [Candidatus Campbellbacteria bacterium GW2011_GWD2_35_24]KKP76739.1 MAG: Ribosome-recycling factor [Candidatus Campbellbacteria bacterium GW2011_GWC1_35_31]KKP78690.1 MAG: Ribosome-recycling factor [Candidatus Campbellbacteria bacterium GW2011_GWD1_35_49]HAP74369.1 ribosome recycling factor [Candidatus Campbellbacteria bacterium]
MSYDFSKFKKELSEIESWLTKEYTTIRTGMASPALLDSVKVESYGSFMPINQLATVGTEDARTIRVSPWDKSQVRGIEKAINDANLGVSVASDSAGVRVIFPELTSERRVLLIKSAKEKLEKARVSLRGEREKVWEDIQKKEKNGEMGEDEKFSLKEEMQKYVDASNKKFEEIFSKKEKEISI